MPVKLQSAARPHPDPVLAPTPFTDFCDGDNGMGVIYWMLTLRSSFEVSLSWSKYWRGISCWWIGKEGGDARNVYQGSLNEWEVERKDWFAILSNSKPHLMNDNLMHSVVYLTQMQILDPFRRWANSVLRTEYEYEYYLVLKNRPNTNTNIIRFENINRIRIRIFWYSNIIRIIFEYRIIRSPLVRFRWNLCYRIFRVWH